MSYEVPSLLLRLKNPEAENEWDRSFKLQLKKHDLLSTYMMASMAATVAIRSAHLKPRIYHYVAIEAVQNCLFYAVQVYDGGKIFAKNRTAIIAIVRTMRLITVSYLMFSSGQDQLAFPLFTATRFSWSLKVIFNGLLVRSFLPVLQSFGFRAPLVHHIWLTLMTLVTLFYFQIPRCSTECTSGTFYSDLYISCLQFLSRLQRLIPGPVRVNVLETLSCKQMCFVTNAFTLTFVGFLVPSLILAAVEEPSRAFVLMRYGGTPFYHSAKTLLLFTFAILPFVAALNFELIATLTLLFKK
jgi:hypothetical protein